MNVILNQGYYNVYYDEWCVPIRFFKTCDGDPMVDVIWESGMTGFAPVEDLRGRSFPDLEVD